MVSQEIRQKIEALNLSPLAQQVIEAFRISEGAPFSLGEALVTKGLIYQLTSYVHDAPFNHELLSVFQLTHPAIYNKATKTYAQNPERFIWGVMIFGLDNFFHKFNVQANPLQYKQFLALKQTFEMKYNISIPPRF